MPRSRSVFVGLLIIILLPGTFACIAASASSVSTDGAPPPSQAPFQASSSPAQASSSSAVKSNVVSSLPQAASGPAITSRAASGAIVRFTMQTGQTASDVPPQTSDIPHLVLHRNGALTAPDERTLIVEVTGIEVPPPGVTVTLQVETQHGDPDLRDGSFGRILVWRESQWIVNAPGSTRTGAVAVFRHEFGEAVTTDNGTIATPTDYFRFDVTVVNAGRPERALSADHAFLMESQWIAPLPEVQEASDGAAPDELVVYYCDMVPFMKSIYDPATWLLRRDIPAYVQTELVPQMIEAFRVQTDVWGFPWYDAWTSYRAGENAERLSVALSDGWTWFHGRAPSSGHSGISIKVSGGDNAWYDTLTEGIMSTFHHELFHNLQRSINLNSGGDGAVDGGGNTWQFFSEGTAALVPSVGQPGVQFAPTAGARAYMYDVNHFLGDSGLIGDLNTSYERMNPYRAAIYWRFLYEQCGGMTSDVEDPAAGMAIIRRALTVLYSGEVVDIRSSADLVKNVPQIMDGALQGSSCPFQSYHDSLIAFARAIYALRLENGRCTAPGTPDGCGFYDPNNQYLYSPLSTITYSGVDQQHAGEIESSFGMDFVDVMLDPTANGQSLTLEFYSAPGTDAEFNVQLWQLVDSGEGASPQRIPGQTVPEVLAGTNADGHLSYVIPAINTTAYNKLGLIITRVDAKESSDPVGAYTIVLRPEVGQ